LSLAYPVADIVMITIVVLVLARARTYQRVTLGLLSGGIALVALSDSAVVYFTADGTYTSGNLFDLGWVGGFLTLGLAALVYLRAPHADSQTATMPGPGRLWLPYVPLALATILAAVHVLPDVAPGPLVVVVVLLVGAVLVRQFFVVLENRRILTMVSEQALRDPLTGLANRTLFFDRLNHALALQQREPRAVAVVSLDLDDFKRVNDSLGHPTGDALLTRVAQRLVGCTRGGDTLARLGGDEFAVLVEDRAEQALHLARRVIEAFDAPFFVDGHRVSVQPSIGIATVSAADTGIGPDVLLKRADIAMYSAKRAGTGGVHTFSSDMRCAEVDAQLECGSGAGPVAAADQYTSGVTSAGGGPTHEPAQPDPFAGPESSRPSGSVMSRAADWTRRRVRHQLNARRGLIQVALLAVIAGFVITTVPGVRGVPGYSWWMDGILQNVAYGAAAALCLVRIPASSPDRVAWRIVAAGIACFGLGDAYFLLVCCRWIPCRCHRLPMRCGGRSTHVCTWRSCSWCDRGSTGCH
jgi:diguanylate cyclase (GGDEF)-like protein